MTELNHPNPQTAAGKVLMHFSVSLDGFVAGPGHDMDWLASGFTGREGVVQEYVATTGAVLGGRDGWDAFPDPDGVHGGEWIGPIFVLTHHPDDAAPADGVTFLDCDVAEAVRIALDAAGGKNVEVLSPTIGRQLLQLGLVDEIDLHIAPVLLGDGIRLYDQPGGRPILLEQANDAGFAELDVRYRPRSTND
jgi:dihydrofolate reductase